MMARHSIVTPLALKDTVAELVSNNRRDRELCHAAIGAVERYFSDEAADTVVETVHATGQSQQYYTVLFRRLPSDCQI